MRCRRNRHPRRPTLHQWSRLLTFAAGLVAAIMLAGLWLQPASGDASSPSSLNQTREAMAKWIEVQQMVAKERKDWQQGREILVARLELTRKEVARIEDDIRKAKAGIDETAANRGALTRDKDQLKSLADALTRDVTGMEAELGRLHQSLPDPVKTKLAPLYNRIPTDSSKPRATAAERFQNVLGIINELNKVANDLSLEVEVRDLGDGKRSEVQTLYVGLTQAYYVSPAGNSGIGRPTPDGWKWQPAPNISRDIVDAVEIFQGKQSPAFVFVPVQTKGK